jgi:hypothetical protein
MFLIPTTLGLKTLKEISTNWAASSSEELPLHRAFLVTTVTKDLSKIQQKRFNAVITHHQT